MKERLSYYLLSRIEDGSDLANMFNDVLDGLSMARIISAPRTFGDTADGKGNFSVLFYESCLWEMYLHGVVSRLRRWDGVLEEYLTEFHGSWKYYASSKRIESINKYGGENDDYNIDGSVRIADLPDGMLRHHTVTGDLVYDDWRDIVQDTKPGDLNGLLAGLKMNANMSLSDFLKETTGADIPMYETNGNGEMVRVSFAGKVLEKAYDQYMADKTSADVLAVCECVRSLIKRISGLDKFVDNKKELLSIHKDVKLLLNLNFDEMDIKLTDL